MLAWPVSEPCLQMVAKLMNCSVSSRVSSGVLCLSLASMLVLGGCSTKSSSSNQSFSSSEALSSSPVGELTNPGNLSTLAGILNNRARLSNSELSSALKELIKQASSDSDKKEASYILARILQAGSVQADLKEALACFDRAKELPALHELSLWHISQVAATLGNEKQVRCALQSIIAETKLPDKRAAAEYGLAQSLLRASENDNAAEVLKKIKKAYAGTPYAVGADYYLGEMDLSRYESAKSATAQDSASNSTQNQNSAWLKNAIASFNQYLHHSPTGRFGSTILDRLQVVIGKNPIAFNNSDFDLYGKAAYAQGRWQDALSFWNKTKTTSHMMESASCLSHQGLTDRASSQLLAAIKHNPADYRYAAISNDICGNLSSDKALKFWRQILAAKPKVGDAAVWNIAIRSKPPGSLLAYKEIVSHYPNSSYAPEAQWWLFWDMVQNKKGNGLVELIHLADSAAQKFPHAKAHTRFLFWAGKLCEKAGSPKQAEIYYRKLLAAFPADYYGYRACDHLAVLRKSPSACSFSKRNIRPNLVNWSWPVPQAVSIRPHALESDPFWELVRLKEYQEALEFKPEQDHLVKIWLHAELAEPRQAITLASHNLSGHPNTSPIWQFSHPLLYDKEIQANCHLKKNVDPFLAHALVREESNYNRFAVSSSQAIGLTQVMPGTAYGVAKRLGVTVTNPSDFFDPALNLKLGIDYLSVCLTRFNENAVMAVASYNGGAGAVKTWISRYGTADIDAFIENIPYRETRDYVRKVFRTYWTYFAIYQKL